MKANKISDEIETIINFVNEGAHVYGGEMRKERVLSYLKRLLVVSNEEYEANKHYIELGKAIEMLFEDYAWVETIGEDFKNTKELLEWAEGRK